MRAVLVTSGGGFQGLGLLESLQAIPSVRPVIADIHPQTVTRYLCAAHHTLPPISDGVAYAKELMDIVERESISAIIPATAHELPTLSRLKDTLVKSGVSVAVSSSSLVETLLDKRATSEYLEKRGVPAQASVDPSLHDFSLSGLFGKPRFGWGGVGTVAVRSSEAAARAEIGRPGASIVWFPLFEHFEEFSADFAIDPNGKSSAIVVRRRLRTSGGFAVISESVDNSALSNVVADAARALVLDGACGIFNIQLIRPSGGQAFISDVNPRFGTSAVHGLFENVNLAAFFLGAARTTELASARRSAVRTVRYLKTIGVPRLDYRPAAVVFDLDDTLVDHKLWMAAKAQGAYDAVARDWLDERRFRLHALQLIDEAQRSHLIDCLADEFSWSRDQHAVFLAAYRAIDVNPTPLFPDVEVTLEVLKKAGFRLAVLTDNPPATQRRKIENAPALSLLSSIIYSRDTGHEKPAVAAFDAVASSLSLRPDQLCMVGDNYFRDALGALDSGYGNAFVVKRDGSFLQPHRGLFSLAKSEHSSRIHFVDSLHVLRETLLPS